MTSFTSHGPVAIQAGVQTIHGNVNYECRVSNLPLCHVDRPVLTDDDTVPSSPHKQI